MVFIHLFHDSVPPAAILDYYGILQGMHAFQFKFTICHKL